MKRFEKNNIVIGFFRSRYNLKSLATFETWLWFENENVTTLQNTKWNFITALTVKTQLLLWRKVNNRYTNSLFKDKKNAAISLIWRNKTKLWNKIIIEKCDKTGKLLWNNTNVQKKSKSSSQEACVKVFTEAQINLVRRRTIRLQLGASRLHTEVLRHNRYTV